MTTFLAIFFAVLVMRILLLLWKQIKPHPPAEQLSVVKRVDLSEKLGAEILRRPGGSYGYRYLAKAEDGRYMPPVNFGTGSVFDTPEKAEQSARENAAALA